jgi:hypothetical protein
MNLPIKFPTDSEVIAEETARFRSLSPENRVHTLGEMFNLYYFLATESGRSAELARLADFDEGCGRQAITEFVSRHGGK